jgi:CDP-6-deoxy-D-xylo-4-hexulose-3-dehydrase
LFGGNLVRQPYMIGRNFRVHGSLANSDTIMNQTFWIGVYPGLDDEHISYVLNVMRDFCATRSRGV